MLDLQCRRLDLRVPQQIQYQLCIKVADPDTFAQSLIYQLFHGRPCLLNRGVTRYHILPIVRKSRRVPIFGIDIFQRDREMHNIQIKVIDTPVR